MNYSDCYQDWAFNNWSMSLKDKQKPNVYVSAVENSPPACLRKNGFKNFYQERAGFIKKKFDGLSLTNKPPNFYNLEEKYWARWKPGERCEKPSKMNRNAANHFNVNNNIVNYAQCQTCFDYSETSSGDATQSEPTKNDEGEAASHSIITNSENYSSVGCCCNLCSNGSNSLKYNENFFPCYNRRSANGSCCYDDVYSSEDTCPYCKRSSVEKSNKETDTNDVSDVESDQRSSQKRKKSSRKQSTSERRSSSYSQQDADEIERIKCERYRNVCDELSNRLSRFNNPCRNKSVCIAKKCQLLEGSNTQNMEKISEVNETSETTDNIKKQDVKKDSLVSDESAPGEADLSTKDDTETANKTVSEEVTDKSAGNETVSAAPSDMPSRKSEPSGNTDSVPAVETLKPPAKGLSRTASEIENNEDSKYGTSSAATSGAETIGGTTSGAGTSGAEASGAGVSGAGASSTGASPAGASGAGTSGAGTSGTGTSPAGTSKATSTDNKTVSEEAGSSKPASSKDTAPTPETPDSDQKARANLPEPDKQTPKLITTTKIGHKYYLPSRPVRGEVMKRTVRKGGLMAEPRSGIASDNENSDIQSDNKASVNKSMASDKQRSPNSENKSVTPETVNKSTASANLGSQISENKSVTRESVNKSTASDRLGSPNSENKSVTPESVNKSTASANLGSQISENKSVTRESVNKSIASEKLESVSSENKSLNRSYIVVSENQSNYVNAAGTIEVSDSSTPTYEEKSNTKSSTLTDTTLSSVTVQKVSTPVHHKVFSQDYGIKRTNFLGRTAMKGHSYPLTPNTKRKAGNRLAAKYVYKK